MACYIVSFEVSDPAKLNSLKEGLKSYGAYCPVNQGCWAILSPKTHLEIRDHLSKLIDSTDRLFVVRSGTAAAWWNAYGPENSEWLKKNL